MTSAHFQNGTFGPFQVEIDKKTGSTVISCPAIFGPILSKFSHALSHGPIDCDFDHEQYSAVASNARKFHNAVNRINRKRDEIRSRQIALPYGYTLKEEYDGYAYRLHGPRNTIFEKSMARLRSITFERPFDIDPAFHDPDISFYGSDDFLALVSVAEVDRAIQRLHDACVDQVELENVNFPKIEGLSFEVDSTQGVVCVAGSLIRSLANEFSHVTGWKVVPNGMRFKSSFYTTPISSAKKLATAAEELQSKLHMREGECLRRATWKIDDEIFDYAPNDIPGIIAISRTHDFLVLQVSQQYREILNLLRATWEPNMKKWTICMTEEGRCLTSLGQLSSAYVRVAEKWLDGHV